MRDNPGRVGAVVVAIVVILVIVFVVIKPGSSKSTSTQTGTNGASAKTQSFTGTGNKSLGTVTVSTTSEATFNCPLCQNHGFAVTSTDSANPTAGLNTLSKDGFNAQFEVSPGTYTEVKVKAAHPWTLKIVPGTKTHGSGY